MNILQYPDGDYSERNEVLAVGTSNVLVSRQPVNRRRKNITITNTSAGAQKITIFKGIGVATAGAGIVIQPTGSWTDSTVNPAALCYQGTISVISDAVAGQISISEEME